MFFVSLAPGFEPYVTPDGFNRSSKADLEECSKRFALVTAAFKERGFQLRREEPSSRAFIAHGVGTIECVIENAEELEFLIANTDFAQRRDDKIKYFPMRAMERGLSLYVDSGSVRMKQQWNCAPST